VKIAVIADTHVGVRNDNSLLLAKSGAFFRETFFPYLDEHGIRTVIHVGDVLDRRKYVSIATARALRQDFTQPILDRGIDLHITLGNHDVTYKNTNEVSSVIELLGHHPVSIYDTAQTISLGGVPMLMVPWICDDNRERSIREIASTEARVCFGHLEIAGFEMYRGSVSTDGMSRDVFQKFDAVYSGHFHHKSSDGHIFYLGSAGYYTWADHGDSRGFHVFDTDTREMEFVRNPHEAFKKLRYNDTQGDQLDRDFSLLRDCYVKIVVESKTDAYAFDKFFDAVEAAGVYDLQVVEDTFSISLGGEDDDDFEEIVHESESTLQICMRYVDRQQFSEADVAKIEAGLVELYNESMSME
jgi:DNA repair exonuclease SbcCD nuclease subunit